jgi:geranylgeranyl reductase family protein
MQKFDVAVVGAGPAGSAAAISLARRGYSVALIDKERFPREKLCGDFLNPINWPLLRELGVAEQILGLDHGNVGAFRITSLRGNEASVPLPSDGENQPFGLGLSRFYLDHLLVERASATGVAVRQGGAVRRVEKVTRGWSLAVADSPTPMRVTFLIGADGRNSWIAHHVGITRGARAVGTAVAFEAHLDNALDVGGNVEIHLLPGGYAGLVRLDRNRINLCFTVARSELPKPTSFDGFLTYLGANPSLKKILKRSRIRGELRSAFPIYFPPRRRYDDGVLLVGDAAQVTEPVTGEGVYFALKSGLLAAEAVDAALGQGDSGVGPLRWYDEACRQAFRRRRGMNSLVRLLMYRPALLAPMIRFSARRKRFLDSMVRFVCVPDSAH